MEFTHADQCTRYGVFEVAVSGPSDGNPFAEQSLKGVFTSDRENAVTEGFYDGGGIYRIRFMPQEEGMHSFILSGTFLEKPLSGKFYVNPCAEGCHGPAVVSDTFHFRYADGTPFAPVGTTCYAWHLQDEEVRRQTLRSLEGAGFNKLRFCVFPKHYAYNFKDPDCFPYEGTPMDASVLNEENFLSYTGCSEGNSWDFTRFNPEYFRRIENCIEELGNRGIEADLILMHPYDRWGFSSMPREADDLYYHYVISRFAAYRNVWWSLANEYDLMRAKTAEDWEHFGEMLVRLDPYHHLRSVHNCRMMFDHSRNWITHCSVQRVDLYKGAELTDALQERYGKPVVMDEIAYEGDLPYGWGNITGEEMNRRMWETAMRGGYPGHGETFLSEDGVIWWSHGGLLHGESWKRISFLKQIISAFPESEIVCADAEWDSVCAVPRKEWASPVKSMYVYYYSFMRPSSRKFQMDSSRRYHAEVIDTWNMEIEDAGVFSGTFTVPLPARPYMAVRLTETSEPCRPSLAELAEEAEEAAGLPVPEEAVQTAAAEESAEEETLQLPAEEEDAADSSLPEEPETDGTDFMDVVDQMTWRDGMHNNDTDEIPEFLTGSHHIF